MLARPLCSLCTKLSQARAYSVASKTRRTKPAFNFESTSSSPSTPPRSEAIPTARSTPTSVPNPGSSTLVRSNTKEKSRPFAPPLREPPLVEAARKKSVKQRNVFESYLVLSWKTRLYFWTVIGAVAVAGLYGGDYFVPETEEEKAAKEVAKTASA